AAFPEKSGQFQRPDLSPNLPGRTTYRCFHETAGIFMSPDQCFNFLPKRSIPGAFALEERLSLVRFPFQRLIEDLIDLTPALRIQSLKTPYELIDSRRLPHWNTLLKLFEPVQNNV